MACSNWQNNLNIRHIMRSSQVGNQNILLKRYQEVSSMKGLQKNMLLRNVSNMQQNVSDKNSRTNIKEIILDQKKIDAKIDVNRFNKIVNQIDTTHTLEREKLWQMRTNQPYKNILPAKEIKKTYSSPDELIIYKVKKEDRDSKQFEENAKIMKKTIAAHNIELSNTYPENRRVECADYFKFNNETKYQIRYDPESHCDMKDNIIEYYKKEQLECEKDKQCVDDIIEKMVATNVDMPADTDTPNISVKPPTCEPNESASINKYAQRQKKI